MSDNPNRYSGPGAVPGAISLLEKMAVPMHSLLVDRGGQLVHESYWDPWKRDDLHRIYSCTKSFVALAIGSLVKDGLVSLDDHVIDFFPEHVEKPVHPWLGSMSVRDALMMRTCHRMTTYKIGRNGRFIPSWRTDWVKSFFDTEPDHEPGSVFIYDTSSSHTLASLVERLSGKDFVSYLREKFLDRLGVSPMTYVLKDPEGNPCGGSGLMMRPVDLLSVICAIGRGQLCDVIDAGFLKDATSPLSPTLRGNCGVETGYGYFFWTDDDGSFAMMGLGGQYAVYNPEKDIAVVTTADTQGMKCGDMAIRKAISMIFDDCTGESATSSDLCLRSLKGEGRSNVECGEYIFENSAWDSLSLDYDNGGGVLEVHAMETVYSIPFAFNQNRIFQFPVELSSPAAASAAVLPDGSIQILVQLLGCELGSMDIHISQGQDSITVVSSLSGEVSFKGFDLVATGRRR